MRAAYLSLLSLWLAAGVARGAAPGTAGELDDPKMARRLKTRIAPPVSTAPSPDSPASPVATAATAASGAAPASERESVVVSPRVSSGISTSAGTGTASPTLRAQPDTGRVPLVGIGYRRFSFVQVGASSGSTTGASASEPFNSLSLDFYPVSRFIRFGLSTQYGWQDGRFNAGNGDYFIAQSASLGIQSAGPRVTPFAEAFAGGGYMRRFQFDRTIPTAYWQFGIDAGANFFLADLGFVSVALGYLRPVNGFLKQQAFTSVYVDTWSLKLGFGL